MNRRWIWALMIALCLASLTSTLAMASLPPFNPTGTVQLNGENVPDGIEIRAFCGSVQAGYTQTYTYNFESWYSMTVIEDDPSTPEKDGCEVGETVTFKVWNAVADQTAVWKNGFQLLNLTATKPLPNIALEKGIDGYDASSPPGPYLEAGSELTFTYTVTNSGETVLTEVTVIDDNGTPDDPEDDIEVCVISSLEAGAIQTCTLEGEVQPDAYVNVATVTGVPPEDDPPVTASASAYYFGVHLNTTLVKFTNEEDANLPPGVYLEEEANVFWEYVVTNNGNVTLTGVSVEDDQGVTVICPKTVLAPGETMTCTASGQAVPGQYANIGTVTGMPPVGGPVSASDPSHYFGSAPKISILKRINGYRPETPSAPGLYLLVGADITWTYEVENTGNVTLTNVRVVDDLATDGAPYVVCTIPSLAAGDKDITSCSLNGTADLGQYHNTATVTGTPPVGSNVTNSDESFYFGSAPAVEIEFNVNGAIADSSPGLYVLAGSKLTLDYVVTNTGNVDLSGLVVKDGATTVCTITSLAVGADPYTCTDTTQTAQIGQHSATATVTATPPGGLAAVINSNVIYYFGSQPALTLVKKTNGQDIQEPVYVLAGSTVNWTYQLENTGNVRLDNITVVDDHGTPENPEDDHTVCSEITLEPGGTHLCKWSQTAQTGLYENTATVTADPPTPLAGIFTYDSSSYFGATLDVSLVKQTNGLDVESAPGPLIAVGAEVNWTYVVSNSSNVPVDFTIADSPVPASGISCDKFTLAAKVGDTVDSVTCTASGTAIAGQYENTATITVTPPGGLTPYPISDTSHYFGVTTGITLEKKTNGFDADTGTGPLIKVGETVTWTYEIANTGNVDLTAVILVDDVEGAISCPSTTLAAGDTVTCTKEGIAQKGQYSNLATVTANPPAPFTQVSDSDPSYYFGSDAGVAITKLTNGSDGVPYILFEEDVEWTYLVQNVGNLPISNIVVTDSDSSLTITCDTSVLNIDGELDPGLTMTCSAYGKAIEGPYENTSYVEAVPEGFETEKVQASDTSAYFGANPSITIEKSTNGEDADEAPGPYIPVGEQVTFMYQVSNPETLYTFSEIEVTDDAGVTVVCDGTTLAPGDDPIICTAESEAEPGPQTLAGHVSAKVSPLETGDAFGTVHTHDFSHYFGFTLNLELVKLTNGQLVAAEPGPELVVGSTVTWTYVVTNTSNVSLVEIELNDEPEGIIICPNDTLDPNTSMECEITGIVIEGPYENQAYVTAMFGDEVLDKVYAISWYSGVAGGYWIYLPLLIR